MTDGERPLSDPDEGRKLPSLPYLRIPCEECPWLVDAVPGRFPEERWLAMRATCDTGSGSAPPDAPLFACHKTRQGAEYVCAGWLAREGSGHVGIRIAVLRGRLPAEALSPSEGWPPLHPDLFSAAEHDLGVSMEAD
jgi:hypothetical protein